MSAIKKDPQFVIHKKANSQQFLFVVQKVALIWLVKWNFGLQGEPIIRPNEVEAEQIARKAEKDRNLSKNRQKEAEAFSDLE